MAKVRLLLPRVRHAQFPPPAVPRRKAQRHEPPFNPALAQKSVDRAQHLRRPVLLRPQAAQRPNRHRSIQRRRASLSRHVAHRHAQFPAARTSKSRTGPRSARANSPRRAAISSPYSGPGNRGKQRALNPARRAQVALHARFVPRHLLVQLARSRWTPPASPPKSKAPAHGPA